MSAAVARTGSSMSPMQRRAAWLIAFGEFIDGYDLLVMGVALLFLRPQLHLSTGEIGALGAATFLGAAAGLVVFGDLSDRLGRKAIFMVNLVFFVAFAIASAMVTQVWQLFLVRVLIGVGVGMDIPTSTAYLAEIAPKEKRGALLGSLLNVMWILGALTSTLLALPLMALFGDAAWRWMFGLAAIPAFVVLIARRTLPESPRWLLTRGRVEEARAVYVRLGLDEASGAAILATPPRRASYRDLFRPQWRGRLLLVSAIFFLNCFTGSITTLCTPLVLQSVGALSTQATLLFSATVWITSLAGVITSSLLIDRMSRRTLCYCSVLPYAACAVLLGIFGREDRLVLFAGFYAISFLGWAGIAVLTWVWASELFPTEVRGRAQGVCNGACRLAAAANVYVAPAALAGVGFGPYVASLALPMLIIALLVTLNPLLDSGRREMSEFGAA